MWDTPNDHSRGHSRTLVRTTILVVAYLTTIPNLMPNRMSLLRNSTYKYSVRPNHILPGFLFALNASRLFIIST
jgi:hypothetical protein